MHKKLAVFVNLEYSRLDAAASSLQQPASGNGWTPTSPEASRGWSIDQTTGKVTAWFTRGLDLGGNSIENVKAIMSASGDWRIGEDGKLVVQELEVRGKGITVYDEATGKPMCAKSVGGVWTVANGGCSETAISTQ